MGWRSSPRAQTPFELRAEGLAAPSIRGFGVTLLSDGSVPDLNERHTRKDSGCCCSPGSSEAGGQGASGGWANGARHRGAGERPGGAEEEGPRDQSTPPKWGQRPRFTGEQEKLGGTRVGLLGGGVGVAELYFSLS